jgi:hypothetical protein
MQQLGQLLALAVVGLVAVGAYTAYHAKTANAPQAGCATCPQRNSAIQHRAPQRASMSLRRDSAKTHGERARAVLDRHDIFEDAVTNMQEEQGSRGEESTTVFDPTKRQVVDAFGDDGSGWSSTITQQLPKSLHESQKQYNRKLNSQAKRHGPYGNPMLHSGYGQEFTQSFEPGTSLWSLLRGVRPAKKYGLQAQVESTEPQIGENIIPARLCRPKYPSPQPPVSHRKKR